MRFVYIAMRHDEIIFPFRQTQLQFDTMPRMDPGGICLLYSVWFLWYGLTHNFNSRAAITQLKEECIADETSAGLGLLAGLAEAGPVTKLLADSSVEDYSGLQLLARIGDDDSKALYSAVSPLNQCAAAQSLLRCNYLVPHYTDGHQTLLLWSQLNSFDYLAIQTWEFSALNRAPRWSNLDGREFILRLLYQKLLTRNMLFEITLRYGRGQARHSIAAFYDPSLNGFVLFDSIDGVLGPFPDIGAGDWMQSGATQAQDTPFRRFCRYFESRRFFPTAVTAVLDYRKRLQGNDAGHAIVLQISNRQPLRPGCQLPEGIVVPVEEVCDRVLFERLFKKSPLHTKYNYEQYPLYNRQRADLQPANTYFF